MNERQHSRAKDCDRAHVGQDRMSIMAKSDRTVCRTGRLQLFPRVADGRKLLTNGVPESKTDPKVLRRVEDDDFLGPSQGFLFSHTLINVSVQLSQT